MLKSSALSTGKLSVAPVRMAPSRTTTASLTHVRNASHANKVRQKLVKKRFQLKGFSDLANIVKNWKSHRFFVCSTEYAEKCTPTSNARCSCDSGFLCSNNVCSACEENKCTTGEKLKRTETPIGGELLNYSYQCELVCPGPAYFDVKANHCKPWTQCSAFGLAELFPGNKTHNSVCDVQALTHGRDRETAHVILGISFAVFSLAFLVSFFLSFTCVKNLRKHKANHYPMLAVSTNNTDYHLSKEESGLQLIIQDESKDNNNIELHLGRDTTL
ncbi:tumor necrosis factor receptor superfamily member 3-like [Solea senegalensis]|uniref:Tumor necrosis factor receptor superfamily member 3-like n=1 Tax=Solea senegalensis TaxID=28829 RepID=A0AAV6QQQ5_SOLSE|nr:tumor necrosis factor receptor superfamily member 3-like [Solea senegalensis]